MKSIELRQINHYYGKDQALENINLTIEEGEFFTFVVTPLVLASNNISDYSSEHFKPPRPRI